MLRSTAFVAFKSLRKRGAEIGGFLTKSSNSEDEFQADRAVFVPCEHLFGPSYHLSASDLDVFRQRLAESEHTPVGYFRSCTREMRVEPEDIEVLRELLPEAKFIVLLKAFPNGNAEFRIFGGEDHEVVSEFELRMSLTQHPEPSEQEPDTEVQPSPFETIREATVDRVPSPFSASWPIRIGSMAAIVVAVALVVFAWPRPPKKPSPAGSAHALGLRVARESNNFRVTWNRTLPLPPNAAGTLSIDDGRAPRELQLDAAQITGGSVVYISDATDLTFRMKVRGDDSQGLSESVRVVVAEAPVVAKNESIPAEITSWPALPRRGGSYHPPVPLRRINLEIPSSSIQKTTVVEVKVRVDSAGRVSDVRQVVPIGKVPAGISTQVLDASKQWTFEPAKLQGRNVASDYVIVYSFSPPAS
jgi:hypothetical protein